MKRVKNRILSWLILPMVILVAFLSYRQANQPKPSLWEQHYEAKKARKLKGLPGDKQARIDGLIEYNRMMHTRLDGEVVEFPANYKMIEYHKALANQLTLKSSRGEVLEPITWVPRGPGNVGGRTRGLIVDPDDATHHTWFAGSATGGVWKTVDGGVNWEHLTADIPYSATTTLEMAMSNTQIIYMGTGESFTEPFSGGGIFKSTDKGDTWNQLASTAGNEDFRFVNRIAVDPDNEHKVVVATNEGIYRSLDGGDSWTEVYASNTNVEDLRADTSDFRYLYASENGRGLLRSVDSGATWIQANNGIEPGLGRIELAVSPTNPSRIIALAENLSGNAKVFVSDDRAQTWYAFSDLAQQDVNILGGQGGYDNTAAFHPYSDDTVFLAGVNMWKISLTNELVDGEGKVTDYRVENTESFLSFVNFAGNLYPGMNTGDNEEAINLQSDDWVSVEVRFGPGKTQKAHRFTVPSEATSGVPASDYTYQDYVDVPFEVWDVTNNQQLMCSFRDQGQDGAFNLYEATGDTYGTQGREYLFINSVPYDAVNPSPNIAKKGGRSEKLIYFFWPTLKVGATWEPANLPESKIIVEYGIPQLMTGNLYNVSDAYGNFSEKNTYKQSLGLGGTSIPGFHPDHHNIVPIPINEETGEFWILNGNDGGLGISKDNGVTFSQVKDDYLTTQFYDVAKKKGANEFIGGMQDNGTWQSPIGENASLEKDYFFRVGGDGFEVLWHPTKPKYIMASVYNNSIRLSKDGGLSWTLATNGITKSDGPFITRLENIPSKPDYVYAIGSNGLYYTASFGTIGWKLKTMPTGWKASTNEYIGFHQVKVSLADNNVIWAGGGNTDTYGLNLFVSEDQGATFNPVNSPAEEIPFFHTGFATHPVNRGTAYALYSVYGGSKIMRTQDLGETWEDITGFSGGSSTNGFPDVGCYSLLVFPDDTNRIWAGTEIGVFETLNNGENWHILSSNMPAVPIFQLYYQDGYVITATYGHGIWTYLYDPTIAVDPVQLTDAEFSVYPNPSNGDFKIRIANSDAGEMNLAIYNLSGKQVYASQVIPTGDDYIEQLELQGVLAPGTYLLKVSSDVKTGVRKIIVQ